MDKSRNLLKNRRRDGGSGNRDLSHHSESPPVGNQPDYHTDPLASSRIRREHQRILGILDRQEDAQAVQTYLLRACADALLDAAGKLAAWEAWESRSGR